MKPNNALQVLYDERLVGTLAMTADHKAAFQYSEEWLENGFPISPSQKFNFRIGAVTIWCASPGSIFTPSPVFSSSV